MKTIKTKSKAVKAWGLKDKQTRQLLQQSFCLKESAKGYFETRIVRVEIREVSK